MYSSLKQRYEGHIQRNVRKYPLEVKMELATFWYVCFVQKTMTCGHTDSIVLWYVTQILPFL